MEISIDELSEILAEAFEQHKGWYRNEEELIGSFLREVKRLCGEYNIDYDEEKAYKTIEYFERRYGLNLNYDRRYSA